MRIVLLSVFSEFRLLTVAGICLPEEPVSAPQGKPDSPEPAEARKRVLHLKQLADAPATDGGTFWEAWRVFRLAHGGSPEYAEAAARLRHVSSPLDGLDRCDIFQEERLPWLPPEVVAVLGEHRGRDDGIGNLSISADGALVANGDRVWDAATMNERALLTPARGEVYHGSVFAPKGRLLAAWHSQGVTLWDLSDKAPVRRGDLVAGFASSSHYAARGCPV